MIDAWHELYVMLGSATAALLGLLFVAASLHLDDARGNAVYERRARNNTLHMLVLLVEAAIILMPQPVAAAGSEIAAVNLLGLWIPLAFTYRMVFKARADARRGGWGVHRALTYIGCYLLGAAGGLTFIQSTDGLYLITASYIFILVTVVMNAWRIMLGLNQPQKTRQ
ncbi:MAG TPA: hypothetical protein VEU53_08920 [Stellaceae bacterium]|nr:hypothetical protein [Stellaceae bacterium]